MLLQGNPCTKEVSPVCGPRKQNVCTTVGQMFVDVVESNIL